MNRKQMIKKLLNQTISDIEKYDYIDSETAQNKINELIEKIQSIKPEDDNIVQFLFKQPVLHIKHFFLAIFKDLINGVKHFKNKEISKTQFVKICTKTFFNTMISGIIIFELLVFSLGSSMPFSSTMLLLSVIGFAAQRYLKK